MFGLLFMYFLCVVVTVATTQMRVTDHTFYAVKEEPTGILSTTNNITGETPSTELSPVAAPNNQNDEEDESAREGGSAVGPWPHKQHGAPAAWERVVSAALHVPAALLLALALAAAAALRPARSSAHARSLACHAAALLAATVMQLWWAGRKEPTSAECYVALLTYQFSYLASYFWLNAMCVDMYLAFRILTGAASSESARFVVYSLYAWGLPVAYVVATAGVQFGSDEDSAGNLYPFNAEGCFFVTNESLFLYLYGPVSVLLIINLFLFVLTATRIHQLHRDTAILDPEERGTTLCGQGRATLYVRLLWSMGVIEMAVELMSWDQGRGTMSLCIRSVVDLCRAISVFAVACCRAEVLRELCALSSGRRRCRRGAGVIGGGTRSGASTGSAASRQSTPCTPRNSRFSALAQQLSIATIESLVAVKQ